MGFSVTSNFKQVTATLSKQLTALQGDRVVRTVLLTSISMIYMRVHNQGLDADGGRIGSKTGKPTYNFQYWKYVRPKYNRREEQTKKVLQLTGKTSDDFTVGALGGSWVAKYSELKNGAQLPITNNPEPQGWGIGWANTQSGEIAQHQIDMHGDNIYALSANELQTIDNIIKHETEKILNNL